MPFYTQQVEVDGFVIQASARVSPYALAEAAWLARKVLSPRDRRILAEHGIRMVIPATTEMLTDLPEYAALTPKVWWDWRYRGVAGTDDIPRVVCPEEDLLDLPGQEMPEGYSTCVHELSHELGFAREQQDPTLLPRMEEAYTHAMATGLWRDTYASDSAGEYFTAGVEVWLGTAVPSATQAEVTTREQLRAYDPALAAICADVLGDRAWRYRSPETRPPRERAHLRGFDRSHAQPFEWPARARLDPLRLPWIDDPPPRSPDSDASTWLVFANHRHVPVDVDWLDFDGVREPWFTLRPGEEKLQDAYAGHAWFVHQGARDLGAVVVGGEVGYVDIGVFPLTPLDRDALDRAPLLGWATDPPPASPPTDDTTWILWVNRRPRDVVVEWVDFDGVHRPYHTLAPGESLARDAFVGHVWSVTEHGVELGSVVIAAEPARVVIE